MAQTTIQISNRNGKKISLPTGLFIDNKFVPSVDDQTIELNNPASGEVLGSISAATARDVDIAVATSLKAYQKVWRNVSAARRRQLLSRLADLLERDLDIFAAIEANDVGSLYGMTKDALGPTAVEWLRYFAGTADKMEGRSSNWDNEGTPSGLAYTKREPYGVTAAIVPWNAPLMLTCWKIAPCIAAGNTLVIKPPELAPLSALKLAELVAEAGFPPGVINVVPGLGHTAGSALAHHMDVRKIAFTGSTMTGRMILEASAKSNLKKVSLELGGKSPVIVFDDAEFEEAVTWAAAGITAGEGQICAAGSRIYVQDTIYQKFLNAFSEKCKNAAFGDPLAADTCKGPLISDGQRDKVLGFIDRANKSGIPLLHGGKRSGNSVENTAFYDVPSNAEILREEVFGPVAVISKFSTEAEVIQKANDSEYGLSASVYTTNLARAHRVSDQLQSGQVTVNAWGMLAPNMPFGGFKQSGFGRDGGPEALDDWSIVKSVKIAVPKL